MRLWILAAATLTSMLCRPAECQEETQYGDTPPVIRMTATEWPPYMGKTLKNQGFLTDLLVQTFAEAGYDLKVDFSAWQRSLATAFDSVKYVGTLTVYRTAEREQFCHLSVPYGESVIGFVQRRDTPITWETLSDLTGVRIGSVAGYANTPEFDRLAREQILDVSTVPTDLLNMRRVAFGRIELAVIDKYNMLHLLASDPRLASHKDNLEFNPRPLAVAGMHLCFNRTEEGRHLRDIFDAAFEPDTAQALIAAALAPYGE